MKNELHFNLSIHTSNHDHVHNPSKGIMRKEKRARPKPHNLIMYSVKWKRKGNDCKRARKVVDESVKCTAPYHNRWDSQDVFVTSQQRN
jgi:hypothetical protein